jgi:nitroreductase
MDYNELLKCRRSVRDYEEKMIPEGMVHEILREACLAPSACNKQPWRFIIIEDADLIKRLSDESKSNLLREIEGDPDGPLKRFEGALKKTDFNVFYNAPCLVIVVGENNYLNFRDDCSLFTSYFMLGATNKGLATCWIGLGASIIEKTLREEIGLPDGYEVVAPIIVGYPKNIPDASKRQDPIILKDVRKS